MKAVIYTKVYCRYCDEAKRILTRLNVEYDEIDVTEDETKFNEMLSLANGRKTVPQIFINNKHVGGCDDLKILITTPEWQNII